MAARDASGVRPFTQVSDVTNTPSDAAPSKNRNGNHSAIHGAALRSYRHHSRQAAA